MQNEMSAYTQSMALKQERKRRWYRVVRILTAIVVFCTTYALILPALTMTKKTFCDVEAHTHSAACYGEEGELTCELPEHEHTLACYADPTADTETAEQWEAQLQDAAVFDTARENLLAIVETQHGYEESSKNYIVDANGAQHGYTRYGAFAETPYADWNSLFVSFCCHYAGIEIDGLQTLSFDSAMISTAYDSAAAGDLLLLDSDGDAVPDRIAVITDFDGTTFDAVSGDEDGAVTNIAYLAANQNVCGCILLDQTPTNPPLQSQSAKSDAQSADEPVTAAPKAMPKSAPLLGATGGVIDSGTSGSMTWTLYADGELVISGSGNMNVVPWRPDHITDITKVTIEEGITRVGNNAFNGCANLTEVSLPSTVNTIDSNAFQDCTALTQVNFPASLTTISGSAFSGCTSLPAADFSDCPALAAIGQSAFRYCSALESLDLSGCASITSIPNYCFENCTDLETVNLTGCTGLTSLGYRAFAGDTALNGIDFSSCASLTTFNSQVFSDCSNLGYANFTGCTSLSTFAAQNFQYCTSLESLDFSGCTNLTSFSYNNFRGCTSLKSVSFAGCENLTSISYGTFPNCTALESVDFSGCSSLTAIGQGEFQSCPSLKTVDFSGCTSIQSFDNSAFSGCSSLETIDLNSCTALTTIGQSAFQNCTSLETVDLSGCASLTSIGNSAFSSCTKLQSVDLTGCSSLTTIGSSAFSSNSALTTVTLDGCTSLETIGTNAFQNCSSLEHIDLSAARNSLTSMASRAFGRTGLVEIDLHDFTKLTTVGIGCFDGCGKLETVNFNGCTSLTGLGGDSYLNSRQFYGTSVLQLVDLRGCTSLETIGSECFSTTRNTCTFLLDGCTSLKYIYSNAFAGHGAAVPLDLSSLSSLEAIYGSAFVRCRFTGTLVIPEKVVSIGSSAFGNTSGYGNYNQFTKIDLSQSESLETIGTYAFAYIPVRDVDFSGCSSLITISANAFRNDLALRSIDLSACTSLTTIGDAAFRDCSDAKDIFIPVGVTSLNESAFTNCSAVQRLVWNAANYPVALGSTTFTAANGFANGYAFVIGKDTETLPDNLFVAAGSCGDIFFEGENMVLSIPASASAGAPAPIGNIDGICYVDSYGVVYELSDDGSSASVAYCPPGIEDYTVPAHITVNGTQIPVTGVNPSAFILARDLQHVTFEDASAITDMGSSAFYGVGTLTQVTDAATGTTETTVSGARALFTNTAVAASVFKNTGLTDNDTERPWKDGTIVDELSVDNGGIRLSVFEPSQSSLHGAGYTVADDGTYQYLTGAYYNAVVAATNDSNHAVTARVYFDFSNVNHIGMDSSFVIEGSNIEVTLRDTNDPDIKCFEFQLQAGETTSFSLLTTYPSPDTSGGEMRLWIDTPDSPSDPIGPTPLNPGDPYISAQWRTERQDRKVSKSSSSGVKTVGDGNGGTIAGLQQHSWSISLPNDGATVDPNYGKDYCRQVNLSDMLTLPNGVHWNEDILSAIARGDYEIRSSVGSTNRVLTLYIQKEDGTSVSVLTLNVPSVFSVQNCSIVPVTGANDEVENLRLLLELAPKTERTELPTSVTTLTVNADMLELHLDELTEDIADLQFPITMPLVNDLDGTFRYNYSAPIESSASASKVITAPAASLSFTKTRASGSNINYNTYMGMDETFNLLVSNLNTGSTTGLEKVSDPLMMFMYIKPANMERMFAETYGDRLTITINNAQLYDFTPYTAVAVDGTTEVTCDAANSSKDEPIAQAQTITIRKAGSGYYVCLGSEIPAYAPVYASVKEGLDALGYIVTAGDTYTVCWTFTQGNDTFIVYGGLKIPLNIYLTHKTSFGLLTEDWHHHYDCDNEWTQTMMNTAQMAYRDAANAEKTASSSCSTYKLRYDFTIGKSVARNGETLTTPSAVNFTDGDELEYTISVNNRGAAAQDLPLVDDSTGSEVILVPVAGNENVDWGSGGTPDIYTWSDGSQWYVLDRDGEYRHVTVGKDGSGKDLIADSVTVQKTYSGLGDVNGYTTKIKWYYDIFPASTSTPQTVAYRALVRTNGNMQYSFRNTAWINDNTDDRLYAQIGGGGSILTFDKQIVTANANIDGNTRGETFAPNDYLALTERNHVVTYKITLQSGAEGKITLSGNDIFDRLPQTFGIFDWSTANVELSYRTDDPEHVVFTGMDDWYIDTASPIPAFWQDDEEGQFYIRWPQESSVRFTEPAEAYIYVTLTYTDSWDVYSTATEGNSVENVVYVNEYPENVVHDIVGSGSAVLQKGVNLIRKAGLSQTREFYDNAYSHLEYYVVLYNGGTTRLYLTDLKDILPRGFTFRRVDPMSDRYFSKADYSDTATTYSDWSVANDRAVLPVEVNDTRTVHYKSVNVEAIVDGQNLTFHMTGSKTNENYAAYDENYGYYYLRSGEAIVFCYTVAIDPQAANTDDAALNRISMEYLDPQNTGLSVYEDAEIGGRELAGVDRNDGNCFISHPGIGVEQLNSEVTVRRGEILPGVNKRLESFTYGGTTYPVISEEDSVDPMAELNWSVETYNEGTAAISGYTLTDVMQYPYRFGGEVRYTIYDLDGRSVSSGVYDSSGSIEQALFTITAHDESTVTLRDIAGQIHTVQINGDPVTLNLPYVKTDFNGVSRTHYTETPYFGNTVLQGTVDVAFKIDPQTNQEQMSLTFPENIMIHFPGCVGKLKVTTQKSNVNVTNTSYVNTAFFGPADTSYSAYLVDHGTPLIDDSGDNTGVESYGFVTVRSGWATNSKKTVKEDARPDNRTTSLNPNPVITLLDEEQTFTYGLEVKNTNAHQSIDYLLLIDNLPRPDDVYTLQPDLPRYSDYTVNFAQDLNLQVYTIDDSDNETLLDPSTYTVEFNDKDVFDDDDWNGAGSGWSTVRTEQSRSIRVILDDTAAANDETNRLMPAGTTVRVSFRASCGADAGPGLNAYNSFAYRYSMNGIWLEASPLLVGVRVPDYPYLQKRLVNRFGAAYAADEDETFSFLVYEGAPIEGDYDDVLASLNDAQTPYHIYTVTVAEGETRSELVKLYPEGDWIWQQGMQYSVREAPTDRNYTFSRWYAASGSTVTFLFDSEKTQVFTAENRSARWDLHLTKVDAQDEHTLSDAVFAVYSPNAADQCTDEQLREILRSQPNAEAEYTDSTGSRWYLMQLLITDENGRAQMEGLQEENYLMLELQAPAGYHLLTDALYIGSADLAGQSLILERVIPNDSGYELPVTGGIGAYVFILCGAFLIMGGLTYAVRRRKRSAV